MTDNNETPNSDLDKAVAKVIGIELHKPPGWPWDPDAIIARRSDLPYVTGWRSDDLFLPYAIFNPSANWAAAIWALQVAIDKIDFWGSHRENWDALVIGSAWEGHNLKDRCWMCNIGDSGTVAFGETGPLAICLAILAAASEKGNGDGTEVPSRRA